MGVVVTSQSDSTRVPEWFGRRWRLRRAILRESQNGLGVVGPCPERFYASPRVVWASLAHPPSDSTRVPEWFVCASTCRRWHTLCAISFLVASPFRRPGIAKTDPKLIATCASGVSKSSIPHALRFYCSARIFNGKLLFAYGKFLFSKKEFPVKNA